MWSLIWKYENNISIIYFYRTQPHPIFQEEKSSDEEDDEVQPVWKKSKLSQGAEPKSGS